MNTHRKLQKVERKNNINTKKKKTRKQINKKKLYGNVKLNSL